MLFDITDDATGVVHEMAEETLLPFVNEVTVSGKNTCKKLRQVQNIDAVHHDYEIIIQCYIIDIMYY